MGLFLIFLTSPGVSNLVFLHLSKFLFYFKVSISGEIPYVFKYFGPPLGKSVNVFIILIFKSFSANFNIWFIWDYASTQYFTDLVTFSFFMSHYSNYARHHLKINDRDGSI